MATYTAPAAEGFNMHSIGGDIYHVPFSDTVARAGLERLDWASDLSTTAQSVRINGLTLIYKKMLSGAATLTITGTASADTDIRLDKTPVEEYTGGATSSGIKVTPGQHYGLLVMGSVVSGSATIALGDNTAELSEMYVGATADSSGYLMPWMEISSGTRFNAGMTIEMFRDTPLMNVLPTIFRQIAELKLLAGA